jgi:TusA-related sulfurtransferase
LPEPLSRVGEKLPYLTPGGTLVIPFDSPERYHWWKPDGERLTVAQTMAEVKERVRAALATNEKD